MCNTRHVAPVFVVHFLWNRFCGHQAEKTIFHFNFYLGQMQHSSIESVHFFPANYPLKVDAIEIEDSQWHNEIFPILFSAHQQPALAWSLRTVRRVFIFILLRNWSVSQVWLFLSSIEWVGYYSFSFSFKWPDNWTNVSLSACECVHTHLRIHKRVGSCL